MFSHVSPKRETEQVEKMRQCDFHCSQVFPSSFPREKIAGLEFQIVFKIIAIELQNGRQIQICFPRSRCVWDEDYPWIRGAGTGRGTLTRKTGRDPARTGKSATSSKDLFSIYLLFLFIYHLPTYSALPTCPRFPSRSFRKQHYPYFLPPVSTRLLAFPSSLMHVTPLCVHTGNRYGN